MGNNEPAVDQSDLRIRGSYGLIIIIVPLIETCIKCYVLLRDLLSCMQIYLILLHFMIQIMITIIIMS